MQPRTPATVAALALTGLAALLLAGCGATTTVAPVASDEGEQVAAGEGNDAGAADAGGQAELSYGDTSFTAELAFCSLDGNEDALFHGPAFDASGSQVGYLSGDFGGLSSSPDGEARINLGATGQFESTDEFIAMGSVAGHIVIGDFSQTDLIVIGGAWQADGTDLPTATLKVSC